MSFDTASGSPKLTMSQASGGPVICDDCPEAQLPLLPGLGQAWVQHGRLEAHHNAQSG
jgi:hypothetical protein